MKYSPNEVRRALEENQIVPYFQPLIEFRTGTVVGFEALSRWIHPQHGIVLPENFIPQLDKSGLSQELTLTILRQVVTTAAHLPSHLQYSINISPLQLGRASLPRDIEAAANAGGKDKFPLQRITVEVIEDAFLRNPTRAARIAYEMKELGLRLALDDFGTGYSSLHHLHSLPFDSIKIDQSFVQHMVHQHSGRKIISAILGLGLSLGLTTVAEGIEKEEHREMLQWLGCDLGQGWLFSPPLPAAELNRFLARPSSHFHIPGTAEAAPAELHGWTRYSASIQLANLQNVCETAPVGLCFLDRKLRILCTNPRFAALFPLPAAKLYGRSLASLIPQTAFPLAPYLHRALNGETISHIEVPLQQPGDPTHPREGLAHCQPVRDESGNILGVAIYIVDVTRRRHQQNTLRQRNAWLKALWDSASIGIISAFETDSGCMLSGNSEAERLLRHPITSSADGSSGQAWRMFSTQAQPINWQQTPLMRALREGHPLPPHPVLYQRGDGTRTTLQVAAAPALSATGQILGAVMTFVDLHEQRQAVMQADLAAGIAASLWLAGGDSQPPSARNLHRKP